MGFGKIRFRQAVVASRGGRMVKWRGRVCSIPPTVVIATIGVFGATTAAVIANTIDTEQTTTQNVPATGDWTITPSGSVSVTGATEATAVEVDASFSGTLRNEGAISATVTQGNDTGDARGIRFDGDVVGGTAVNTGSITAAATGAANAPGNAPVRAEGIFADGNLTGSASIGIDGPIVVTAQGGSATAGGYAFRNVSANAGGVFI